MSEFSLTGLRVLREVAALGSFTAAADSLGYSQSAVSRQVAALERTAGSPLFERIARGVRLTDAGAGLLRHASAVIEQIEAATGELRRQRELASGSLRVGAFPTAIAALLPRALAAFRSEHPGVEVALREGTTPAQLRRLDAGSIELAVIAAIDRQPEREGRHAIDPLLEDQLLLALARDHPLARQSSVDVEELAEESWIVASTNAADTLLGVWPSVAWKPHVAYVVREWTAKLGLVAAGLGITVVPALAATGIREDVRLVRVHGGDPAVRTVAIATRAGIERGPAAQAFADGLHETAAALTGEIQRRVYAR